MKTKTTLLLSGILLATLASGFAQTTFTKITTGAIVNDGGSSYGCAWGDYDNDGFIDLVVANGWGQQDFLYRNNHDGTFAKITTGPIVDATGDSVAAVWGDYDNDGFIDLFVSVFFDPPQDFLYRNNGNGTFTRITTGDIVNDTSRGVGAAWADYDGDGRLDLLVANSYIQNDLFSLRNDFLHHGNGNGTFTKILSGPVVSDGIASYGCAWGDFDNDGDLDLAVAGGNGFLYLNQGSGVFTRVTSGPVVTDGISLAWGDYDNDGDLDLVLARDANVRLYRNEGSGSFTLVSTMDSMHAGGVAWSDYDNDGWLDCFVTGGSPEAAAKAAPNRLYHNRADGSFEQVNEGAIATDGVGSMACAWGDINNDGFLDLFVANTGDTEVSAPVEMNNYLYLNNGSSNRWLMVRLIGSASNRSAIGAKVRLQATIAARTFWQLREISGGSGYCSQNDMRTHFGLGDATNIDLVRIEWPSGTVQELRNVAANQILTVTEPPRLQAVGRQTDGSFQFQLTGGIGFRYALETSSNLTAWTPWATVTNASRTILVTDSSVTNAARRFYRAVMQ